MSEVLTAEKAIVDQTVEAYSFLKNIALDRYVNPYIEPPLYKGEIRTMTTARIVARFVVAKLQNGASITVRENDPWDYSTQWHVDTFTPIDEPPYNTKGQNIGVGFDDKLTTDMYLGVLRPNAGFCTQSRRIHEPETSLECIRNVSALLTEAVQTMPDLLAQYAA